MITTPPSIAIQAGLSATWSAFTPIPPRIPTEQSSFHIAMPDTRRNIESTNGFRMGDHFSSAPPPSGTGSPPASGASGGGSNDGSDDGSDGRISPAKAIRAFDQDMPTFRNTSDVNGRIILDLVRMGSHEEELEYVKGAAEVLSLNFFFTQWMDRHAFLISMRFLAHAVDNLCIKAMAPSSGKTKINPFDTLAFIDNWAETPFVHFEYMFYSMNGEEMKLMLDIQLLLATRGHSYMARIGPPEDIEHHVFSTVCYLSNCFHLYNSLGYPNDALLVSGLLAEFKAEHGVPPDERDFAINHAMKQLKEDIKSIVGNEETRADKFHVFKITSMWLAMKYLVFSPRLYLKCGDLLLEHGLRDMAMGLFICAEKHSKFLERLGLVEDAQLFPFSKVR